MAAYFKNRFLGYEQHPSIHFQIKKNIYFPYCTTACAAANLAMGTRKGEQLT